MFQFNEVCQGHAYPNRAFTSPEESLSERTVEAFREALRRVRDGAEAAAEAGDAQEETEEGLEEEGEEEDGEDAVDEEEEEEEEEEDRGQEAQDGQQAEEMQGTQIAVQRKIQQKHRGRIKE